MSDSVKIWLRLVAAAVGVAVLGFLSHRDHDSEPADGNGVVASTTVAGCEPGAVTAGAGPSDWRKRSLDAGPVGIRKDPLAAMSLRPDGSLVTKMPILVAGQDKVTVAVAAGVRARVRLFYGTEPGSFNDGTGFERVRFHPCKDRERTVWPGGIEVEGSGRVRLKVTVADQEPFVVGLGYPVEMDSPDTSKDPGDGG